LVVLLLAIPLTLEGREGYGGSSIMESKPGAGASSGDHAPPSGPSLPQHGGVQIAWEADHTPDDWIDRDPDLLHLTGKHPLNAETPVAILAKNFVTEPRKAYVRYDKCRNYHGMVG
jgi:hypothetical protein